MPKLIPYDLTNRSLQTDLSSYVTRGWIIGTHKMLLTPLITVNGARVAIQAHRQIGHGVFKQLYPAESFINDTGGLLRRDRVQRGLILTWQH